MIILLFIESRLNFINIPLNSTFKSSINYEYIVYRNENPISCFLEFLVSLMPIFADLCQFWPMPMLPKIEKAGYH